MIGNSPAPFHHALLIGATGMLADAARWIAARSTNACVLARNAHRLAHIAAVGPHVHTHQLDLRDSTQLRAQLQHATTLHGTFDLALIWLHDNTAAALPIIASFLGQPTHPARLILLLGSSAADPTRTHADARCQLSLQHATMHEVILGFHLTPNGSRWLTHAEISTGTIDAIKAAAPRTIIGVVKPWSARPTT